MLIPQLLSHNTSPLHHSPFITSSWCVASPDVKQRKTYTKIERKEEAAAAAIKLLLSFACLVVLPGLMFEVRWSFVTGMTHREPLLGHSDRMRGHVLEAARKTGNQEGRKMGWVCQQKCYENRNSGCNSLIKHPQNPKRRLQPNVSDWIVILGRWPKLPKAKSAPSGWGL